MQQSPVAQLPQPRAHSFPLVVVDLGQQIMTAWCIEWIWINVRLVPLSVPSPHGLMPLLNLITFSFVDLQFGLGFSDELRVAKIAFVKGSPVSQSDWCSPKASMSLWIRATW